MCCRNWWPWLMAALAVVGSSASAPALASGYLDFNAYPYLGAVDNDTELTVNTAARFNDRWSYYSTADFAASTDNTVVEDGYALRVEQNLRYHLWGVSPFDATVQWEVRPGAKDDAWRFGVRLRLQDVDPWQGWFHWARLDYTINAHVLQLDHGEASVWQLEQRFYWRAPGVLQHRVYVSGFVEQAFGEALPEGYPSNPIVAEVQMGYRFFEQFYLIGEYRVDQYRRGDINNLAAGIEYKFLF